MKQIGLLLVVAACAHNVSQEKATGADGRVKGAKAVPFDNGEAKSRGIVTYPGGDRVDWKLLELPEGKRGALDLQLTWQAPRPGLQVAFDVFDQWNTPIVATKANARRGRMRTATINDASGKYFVRVYAPSRGDAGAYKLTATFREEIDLGGGKVEEMLASIPDPPKLPGIPDPEPVCDVFDVSNKACEKVCPEFGAPPGWKACAKQEAQKAAEEAKAQAEKERLEKIKNAPKPRIVKTIKVDQVGGGVNVTLGIGSGAAPIDTTWTGQVLIGDTKRPMQGGQLTIIRVGEKETIAKSTLTLDILTQNRQILLTPPGPAGP